MTDESSTERIVSGKSWEDFCDTLKSAGQGKTVLYMSDDFDEEDPEINAMFYGE